MTATEKAKELVSQYENLPINFPYIDTVDKQCIGAGYMTHESAKQCALIAVEEMINELQSYSDLKSFIYINDEYARVVDRLVYWNEVKQEIDKL